LVAELKVMPGHKAKLAGFFTVIDELYPRQQVADQVKAFSQPPQQMNGKNTQDIGGQRNFMQRRNRLSSAKANRVRAHLGPQKTLLQQYENLDKVTKAQFNQHFLQNLEGNKVGQIMQQHVDLEESSNAMNQIFPPEQFLGTNGMEILNEVNSIENNAFN